MSGKTIHMTAKKQDSLREIHNKIRNIKGAEQISKSEQTINNVTIWTLSYEKFYLRTGSYTSVTIVLTEYEQEQTACVVSSGGGKSMANFSYGANRNFAEECVQKLEECGFIVKASDLNTRTNGFVERYFE